MHGLGKLEFENGDVFEGTFEKGTISGVGKQVYKDVIYYGSFKNDSVNGLGVKVYNNNKVPEYSTHWSNIALSIKSQNDDDTTKELLEIVKSNIKSDVENFVNTQVKSVLDKASTMLNQAKNVTMKMYNNKMAQVLTEVPNPEYGILKFVQHDYTFKGQIHKENAHGYGIVYNNKNSEVFKGFFQKGKLVFGKKTGVGSGFFEGNSFSDI
jgi:hypothetical protein